MTEAVSSPARWNAARARLALVPAAPVTAPDKAPAENAPAAASSPSPGAEVARVTAHAHSASKAIGKLAANVASLVAVDVAAAPTKAAPYGFTVREPDDDDVEALEESTAEGFRRKFPDADIPWWLGMLCAAGNLYVGVRRGRVINPRPLVEIQQIDAAAAAGTSEPDGRIGPRPPPVSPLRTT